MKHMFAANRRPVDQENIVRGQDLVYESGATCWQDGHILGNGDMGAIAYAPYWLEWTVNKVDVFDGRKAPIKRLTYAEVLAEAERRKTLQTLFLDDLELSDPKYKGPRQPQLKSCGQVKIRTLANEYCWGAPPPYTCRQTLSLWEATDRMALSIAETSPYVKIKEPRPVVTSFVSRCRNVMAIRMQKVNGPLWTRKIELVRPPDADYPPPEFGQNARGDMVWFNQRCPDGTSYAMALTLKVTGGVFEYYDVLGKSDRCEPAGLVSVEQQGDRTWITVKGDVDIFVSTASSRDGAKPLKTAKQLAEKALADGYETVQREHLAWWKNFWRQSFVQFENDAMLEQLWYFGLYQMGSSLSRAPVPGLNGLWYGFSDSAVQQVFGAFYTMDVNIQLANLPVWMTNHPELGHPFMDTFLKALPTVRAETRRDFGLPGACFPLEVAFDAALGEPSVGSAYRLSFIGGLFCGLLYCWAYRYTQDRVLLKEKVYPYLRENLRFWAAFLKQLPDGRYYVPWAVPCEVLTLSRNAVDLVALLKPCLEMAVEASKMLKADAGERAKWEEILQNYPEYPQAEGRFTNGQDIDPEYPGWWMSQLWPLILAHDARPEVRTITKKTLDYWFDRGDAITRTLHGWPGFFIILCQLYLGDKKGAADSIDSFIKQMLKPNGLMPHMLLAIKGVGPRYRELVATTPENDTALVMLLTQTLLQSHNLLIRVFPGLAGKQTARFGDLRTEGAFLVSAEMNRGKVMFVSIRAEHGGTARLVNPWKNKPVRVVEPGRKPRILTGKILALEMKAGETLLLAGGTLPKRRALITGRTPSIKTRTYPDGTIITLGRRRNG